MEELVLFDMFDFNEVDYLELIEVEFMIFCVCSASFKIFTISNEISSDEIEDFAEGLFQDATKITVADLIKKCKENKKILEFLEVIKLENYNNLESKDKVSN